MDSFTYLEKIHITLPWELATGLITFPKSLKKMSCSIDIPIKYYFNIPDTVEELHLDFLCGELSKTKPKKKKIHSITIWLLVVIILIKKL